MFPAITNLLIKKTILALKKQTSDSSDQFNISIEEIINEDILLEEISPNDLRPEDIRPEDIPVVISNSFDLIKKLEIKIEQAEEAAENAKGRATSAWSENAGLFNRKNAVEALQDSGRDTASALVDGIEAQRLSFELHGQLAEITKYLFALGVGSIALNRSIVRELELKLTGASKEKLSELAKLEIISVIRQLKAQEDMMSKQEKMNNILKEHNDEINKLVKKDDDLFTKLDKIVETQNVITEELNGLFKYVDNQNAVLNDLKSVISKKLTFAYIIGGVGIFMGIIAVLMTLLS